MTDEQLELLVEARASIDAACLLLEGGYAGYAASRAYYAMFYVAQAFLEGEGMAFSKHSAVIAAFGQHFARPGKVPVKFHRLLIEAFGLRNAGDYAPSRVVSAREARAQIDGAEEFLELAEQLIGPIPQPRGEQT